MTNDVDDNNTLNKTISQVDVINHCNYLPDLTDQSLAEQYVSLRL